MYLTNAYDGQWCIANARMATRTNTETNRSKQI